MNAAPETVESSRLVREALQNLYDHVYLQNLRLAELASMRVTGSHATRAQLLRRLLLDAIEALNPGDRVALRSTERRSYAILFGLYVEGQTQEKVAADLGIGDRQLRRDLATAVEAVTTVVLDRLGLTMEQFDAMLEGSAHSVAEFEGEQVQETGEYVSLTELYQGLLPVLERMTLQYNCQVEISAQPETPDLFVNRGLLRQVLLSMSSVLLREPGVHKLTFLTADQGEHVRLGLLAQVKAESKTLLDAAVHSAYSLTELTHRLDATVTVHEIEGTSVVIWLDMKSRRDTTILVVDDNTELFVLFQRYLVNQPYRLVHAATVDDALTMLPTLRPQVITVDLMLPGRDGWELLLALLSEPAATDTAVVVCSVWDERALAETLGADFYLRKPVTANDLREVLALACRQLSGQAPVASPG